CSSNEITSFNYNYLNGPNLQYFNFSNNNLAGSIPSTINWEGIRYLSINNNFLTGYVTFLTQMTNLQYIQISNNHFSSQLLPIMRPITSQLTMLPNITSLSLSGNTLTGTLPNFNCAKLYLFDISVNSIKGNLKSIISSSCSQLSNNNIPMKYFNVQSNSFTGSIPTQVIRFPKINFYGLSFNCLSGTIPQDICPTVAPTTDDGDDDSFGGNHVFMNTSLQILSIDGLSVNSQCRQSPLVNNNIPRSDYLWPHFTGTIPICLYQQENLNTLHLAGNGLTGSLPEDIEISSTLTNLGLSFNNLYGTIPNNFQTHDFN
ncbi:unnamed protein product, partial [Sphagnum jensenii]